MTRALGRAHYEYTIYLNRRRKRSGHLWQKRFFSTPLDRDHVRLALRYVDLNPVRAGLTERAVEYEWSSAVAHVEGHDGWGLLDGEQWRKIDKAGDWAEAIRDPVMEAEQLERIRMATRTGRPLGSEVFIRKLETQLQRPLQRRRPGPAKKSRRTAAAG